MNAFSAVPRRSLPSVPPNVQSYADRYGEQVTANGQADLTKYFGFSSVRGFGGVTTYGGVPTGMPPLAIAPRDVRPSNTAVSVLAEGLGGWYLETRGLLPLARPIGEGPDFIFTDGTTYSLVQVKGTQEADVGNRLIDGAFSVLDYASRVVLMDPLGQYDCWALGIIIRAGPDYDLLTIQVEVR